MRTVLTGEMQEAEARNTFKQPRARLDTQKTKLKAIVALSELCGKDAPSDEQKAACTALTERMALQQAK